MKQPLSMIRATTQSIMIALKNDDGDKYTLAEGEKLIFGLKHYPEDQECVLSKTLTSADDDGEGNYVLFLNPEDTANLDFGCYYYDVGKQSGTAYHNVIECSEFHLTYNITEPEAIGE